MKGTAPSPLSYLAADVTTGREDAIESHGFAFLANVPEPDE